MGRFLRVVCLGWLASACASLEPDPEWAVANIPSASEQVLWEVALMSLDKAGFPVGGGADPSEQRIVSGWFRSMAPFKGKGYREKATVEYDRGDMGEFDVRVRVQHEVNDDIVRPIDPSFAKWNPAPDNVARAEHVLRYMESFLAGDLEVGEREATPSFERE